MKYSICIITVIALTIGCKKFVEVSPPVTLTATKNIYNSSQSATSALIGIYGQMIFGNRNWTYWSSFSTGLYGDELQSYATNGEYKQLYTNSLDAVSSSQTLSTWNMGYNLIYQANAIIEGLQNSNNLNQRIVKQLSAEAHFIRGYWYFYLTNLFGNVPVITTTDYATNAKAARNKKTEVYLQVISDLKYASQNLNENYVDITDTSVVNDRFRPNSFAADAMLARVYLFSEKYDSAALYATKVIDQISLYDTVSLNNISLINNKEAIWQLMTQSDAAINNTYEGYNYILTATPSSSLSSISTQLMDAFEYGDQRKTAWIGSFTDFTATPNKTYYFPYKYKVSQKTSSPKEYSAVLRLAEQYLIRAEARAQTGDLSGATEDLNVIRCRAGLSNTTASGKDALLIAIWHERQVELFCEYGLRWLDLKRIGKVNEVMQVVTPTKGGTWDKDKALWPIPQSEILNDPNLSPNNPGY